MSAERQIVSGSIPDPGSLKSNDTTLLEVNVKIPHSAVVSLVRDIGVDWSRIPTGILLLRQFPISRVTESRLRKRRKNRIKRGRKWQQTNFQKTVARSCHTCMLELAVAKPLTAIA